MITLKEINLKDIEDQKFLYDIIKFRWKHRDFINIKYKTPDNMPTFEDHVKYLNSGKYKGIYRIHLYEHSIGMIYIDINNFNGTFLLPNLLKKALKDLKQKNIKINKDEIASKSHIELFKRHKDVEIHYASINPKNKLSYESLLRNGYESVELIMTITTKNGITSQGKWSIT
jgi:hypothetical protein